MNDWDTLTKVNSYSFDESKKTVALEFSNHNNNPCTMILQFMRKDTIRKRFHPGKANAADFPVAHNRSIVMDTHEALCSMMEDFLLTCRKIDGTLEITTADIHNEKIFLKTTVTLEPFNITMSRFTAEGREYTVLTDADSPLYYRENTVGGTEDYSIIQCSKKPATGKYIGFGEKGDSNLCKNSSMLTYFNFDNMRYKQVYNRGCLDAREPLYHTDPFFMEFYGVPGTGGVYGIFIDNPSETFIDMGFGNSAYYSFGSLFGDLDYYIFLGDSCGDITGAYTALVGHARLKPRYALGYHQGCYGYDTREKVIAAAEAYRAHGIPIDGLHIDVDIQHKYQTFTIYDEKYGDANPPFGDPKGMFGYLRQKGFKCSTNITPIISNLNVTGPAPYDTYSEGREKRYLIEESREGDEIKQYQCYSDGRQWGEDGNRSDSEKGAPYVGE
ncbi:MAG: glycoside hydrolase, partial [bacterium]|nr:glycoside hydrolase [bacterium]